ncbi:MAG: aldose epimerase [Synechococcaceae cyanobacterium SM2_3_60]|nr:aldose epimerase [Synechococcaceae cyanobacterium SM2_3_60]
MAQITTATDGSYLLADGDHTVTVYPERGGIITQVDLAGVPQFYLDTERFRDPSLSVRGGIPILFPICGNLPENRYELDGQTYTLPQHGFGRTSPWQVVDLTTDAGAALTLELKDSEATRAVYPFSFSLRLRYHWQNCRLTISSELTNTSDSLRPAFGHRDLPYSLGYHPYFAAADKTRLQFDLPSQHYYDRARDLNDSTIWPWDVPEIDAALARLEQPLQASVTDGSNQLRFEASADFRRLVFWTVNEKPFYCLEPWTSPRNAINTGEDLIRVAPGTTHSTWFALTWTV